MRRGRSGDTRDEQISAYTRAKTQEHEGTQWTPLAPVSPCGGEMARDPRQHTARKTARAHWEREGGKDEISDK